MDLVRLRETCQRGFAAGTPEARTREEFSAIASTRKPGRLRNCFDAKKSSSGRLLRQNVQPRKMLTTDLPLMTLIWCVSRSHTSFRTKGSVFICENQW